MKISFESDISLTIEDNYRKMEISPNGTPDEKVTSIGIGFKDKDDNYVPFNNGGKDSEDLTFNINKDQVGFLIDFLQRTYNNMKSK